MIETINSAPELFDGFELNVDPIQPVLDLEKESDKAKETKNTVTGINILTSDQQAEALSKALLDEEEDDKEPEKEKEEEENKSEEKEENKEKEKEAEKSKEKESEDDEANYSFKGILEYLDSESIIEFDEELKKLDDDPELLTVAINKSITKGIESYKESLPEIVNELVEFIENGGDPSKYVESLYKPIDINDLDLEEEADQELIVREYLKALETDSKDIDELIESYKDGLILEKQAKVASKKINTLYEKQREELIKEQEQIVEHNKKKSQEYISNIETTINTSKTLAGLTIPDKEKKEFSDYLLKVNPKTGMTKYQEELNKDYVKNSVELAYLKYKNYDFSKAENKGKTEAVKEMKSKIFTKTESTVKGKTKENAKEVDFSAFKSMFSNRK